MNDEELRATLTDLAQRTLGWKGALPEGDLAAQLDSMQRMTLVVAIEDHFHITFDEDDEARLHTLEDLVRVLQRKLGPDVD
jgi:acyl carrier protein